jgi:hypothetical protein
VIEYPFWSIAMGFSTGDLGLGSRVALMESIPHADTIKSKECITRGNRIKPDGSADKKQNTIRRT